jgi:predicted PolB exonuclease-like 3'-5' exonuclease
MVDLGKYAVLDLETRCNVALARSVLHLDETVAPSEVRSRLAERRRAQGHGDFQRLPFHEPVAGALLLADRLGKGKDALIVAVDWVTWRTGELPMASFLERFFDCLAGRTYVGFSSLHFDVPLLELWASRFMVRAPKHFDPESFFDSPRYKYALSRHCDLQKELVSFASGAGSLDELCKVHGLPGKPGVAGSEVEALVESGRLDEVHAYNVTDVLQTHLLFLHTRVRAGRLTRAAAASSAHSAIALTREKIADRLAPGSKARTLLEASLDGCARSPVGATPGLSAGRSSTG